MVRGTPNLLAALRIIAYNNVRRGESERHFGGVLIGSRALKAELFSSCVRPLGSFSISDSQSLAKSASCSKEHNRR